MAESSKPLILVADDDEKLRGILRMKLEAAGFEVAEAGSGEEAIAVSLKNPPALVVMDVRMPVMSGTEAVVKMKQDPKLQGIPVLFLSAFGEQDVDRSWIDKRVAQELGAVDYMKKTESLSTIVAKISELTHG